MNGQGMNGQGTVRGERKKSGMIRQPQRLVRAIRGAIATAFVCAPALLYGQESGAVAEAPADFRGKVTLAYGIVFGCVVLYIVLSMKRNAGLTEEVAFLEKRLDEIQKR